MSNYIWKQIRRENKCSIRLCQMTEYLYIKRYFTICIITKHYVVYNQSMTGKMAGACGMHRRDQQRT